jgi:TolB protein
MKLADLRWASVAVSILLIAVLAGCSGSGGQIVYQYVSERVSYNDDGKRVAFGALGGNGLQYTYQMQYTGGGLTLLTASDDDTDLTDEGGKHPAWSPDGDDMCIASRRGGSQALFLMDPLVGDRSRISKLTDDSGAGADDQPSWSPDSAQIAFASDKRLPGGWDPSNPGPTDIVTINRDGSGRTTQLADGAHNTWPVFSPDGTRLLYTSDVSGNTDIWVMTVGDPASAVNLTASSTAREEAASWSPDSSTIAFHANRDGDFDIWLMNADGSNVRQLTNDGRSDGYPVFSPDGLRLALTRDREVWTMKTDGTDPKQLTRRF